MIAMRGVTVPELKLPERTRALIEEDAGQMRIAKPHDIRMSIPAGVDWNNPAKFPPYVFREYPKMPLLDGNRPIVIDESGTVLVFHDAASEREFLELNPDIADEIERNAPQRQLANMIEAKDDEIAQLRAKLAEHGIAVEAPRNGVAGLVRKPQQAKAPKEAKPAGQAPSGGLAEQIAQAEKAASEPKNDGNPLKSNKK